MAAAQEIASAYHDVTQAGVSLGRPDPAGVIEAPSGGMVQHYKGGDIYWHANTGAFEVHGGILTEYLAQGGPGAVAGGRRPLGYPRSHETRCWDGRFQRSSFEYGAIYWGTGAGAVTVAGQWWDHYVLPRELGPLGLPITSPLTVRDAEVQFFEEGCLLRRSGRISVCQRLSWPRVGQPHLVAPTGVLTSLFVTGNAHELTDPLVGSVPTRRGRRPPAIVEVWDQRLGLRPVVGGVTVPLAMSIRPVTTPVTTMLHLDATPAQPLADRQLYDLVHTLDGGREVTVSPHCVYAASDWTRFEFMHITDMHISSRNDEMHADAFAIGAGADYVNFNDGLREAILVANRLHDAGQLDVVFATGDLVDFGYDDDDDRSGGGNFQRLVEIIQGAAPAARKIASEPLRVPIFLVPGNHDYRPNPYLLLFDVHIGVGVPGVGSISTNVKSIENYSAFNLTRTEAIEVRDRGINRRRSSSLPSGLPPLSNMSVSVGAASDMVATETPKFLLDRIIGMPAMGSYQIVLGPHRVVMIDTGHDKGIVSSITDGIRVWLGLVGEDERSFVGGCPNQEGLTPAHVHEVRQALIDAGPNGVAFIGMHGPPINPAGNEFAHYFRETEHPKANPIETAGFIARHLPSGGGVSFSAGDIGASMEPDWPRDRTAWFKTGDHHNWLDFGAAQGDGVDEFLRTITGVGSARRADLVLCGHGHRRVEYRIDAAPGSGELRFHLDFYFDQPDRYYSSRKVNFDDPVHIQVKAGAGPRGTPQRIRDQRPGPGNEGPIEYDLLAVPTRSDTLATTPNPGRWWKLNRPFVVQTAATGPIEASQRPSEYAKLPLRTRGLPPPTFRGFRLGTVEGPTVVSFRSVTLVDARAASYNLATRRPMTPHHL